MFFFCVCVFFFLTGMYMCLYLQVHLRVHMPVRTTTSLSVHNLCENVQVYVRALICGLLVYWLELTYNCVLF